ncbi:hypothetical protein [Acidihalobacter ferrooxydans]|uniref:hypothetical protein n=1 Tax=Acidihalobacter ferrooxydans TaxID=1765967 RepID=UPI0012EBFE52|nr:hypothetical protein [Acidihalobacter ferrooxydans]
MAKQDVLFAGGGGVLVLEDFAYSCGALKTSKKIPAGHQVNMDLAWAVFVDVLLAANFLYYRSFTCR